MTIEIEPAIHYWGTPVVLLSTLNEDGTPNLSPMSSAWWLGWSCMLGLDASSKTTENLLRTGEVVLNLADASLAPNVNRLAKTTGSAELPLHKQFLGYEHEADKFTRAGLTPLTSQSVTPPRVAECPVQLEGTVTNHHDFGASDNRMAIPARAFEIQIVRAHAHPEILKTDGSGHIDPTAWRPLIMSFRRLFALGGEVHASTLAEGPEDAYAPWKFAGMGDVS